MIFELFFILFLKQVNCLVCNETISILREVPVTYQFTYYEAYEGEDCVLWCTKSRLAVNVGTKLVTKYVDEAVLKCCDGYIEDIDYFGDGLQCVPKCSSPCMNGFCRKPNECACEWGFGLDPVAPNTCRPLCLDGCDLPDCLPTCNQNTGAIDPDTCLEPCTNGTCVKGQCRCEQGYTLSTGICEPICLSCKHGTCTAPGVCECGSGFGSKFEPCEPACSGCEYGTCTAPGRCECKTGYKKENGTCEPLCSKCDGTCITPDVCICDPGWYMNEDRTKCLAHCDMPCGNGSCVSPNVCECHPGYRLNQNSKGLQCMPVCNACEGLCVAPGVCEFEAHNKAVYTTEVYTGGQYDGFDCHDSNCKCNKTICKKVINTNKAKNINKNEQQAANNEDPLEVIPATLMSPKVGNDARNDTFPWIFSEPDELTYHWIYGVIILVELVVIVALIAVFNRKHILNRLKTKKFVPKGQPEEEIAVQYTNTPT